MWKVYDNDDDDNDNNYNDNNDNDDGQRKNFDQKSSKELKRELNKYSILQPFYLQGEPLGILMAEISLIDKKQ